MASTQPASPAFPAANLSATGGISLGSSGSKLDFDKPSDTFISAQQGDSILWVLPPSLLDKGNRSQIGNHALPSQAGRVIDKPALICQHDMLLQDQSTKLLHMLLSGTQSAVCFDTQGSFPARFFLFAHYMLWEMFCQIENLL